MEADVALLAQVSTRFTGLVVLLAFLGCLESMGVLMVAV